MVYLPDSQTGSWDLRQHDLSMQRKSRLIAQGQQILRLSWRILFLTCPTGTLSCRRTVVDPAHQKICSVQLKWPFGAQYMPAAQASCKTDFPCTLDLRLHVLVHFNFVSSPLLGGSIVPCLAKLNKPLLTQQLHSCSLRMFQRFYMTFAFKCANGE